MKTLLNWKMLKVSLFFGLVFSLTAQGETLENFSCKHYSGYKTYVGHGPSPLKAQEAMRVDCWETQANLYEQKTKKPVDAELAATYFVDACINLNCHQ